MTDINSIIEMIEGSKATENLDHSYCDGYNEACDDIIEQLRKMSEWQDISTAPKDGTVFLGYEAGYGIQTTRYRPASRKYKIDAGWINQTHGWRPSHWMPLPQIPK